MRPLDIARARNYALVAGIIGLILCAVGAFVSPAQFFGAYLIAYAFWAGLALGSLSLILLHYLVGGNWGFVTRRIMEAATRTLPLLAVMLIPVIIGIPQLYLWAQPAAAHVESIEAKHVYLNTPAMVIRLILYFVLWLGLMWIINRWSAEQDRTADPEYVRKFRYFGGPALILHVFAVTFAAIDLLMSLEPEWFSTMFGGIIVVGQVLSTLAFSITILMLLEDREPFAHVVEIGHFHDLGNLLLAFVVFWAYVEVSQFIIIWSANLPEEAPWYVRRSNNGWQYLAIFITLFHFAVPFFLLLMRYVKRRSPLLATVAGGILIMRVLDLYWIVQPALYWRASGISWLHFVAPIGIGGVWLAVFFWQLQKRPMLPQGDVRFMTMEAPHA